VPDTIAVKKLRAALAPRWFEPEPVGTILARLREAEMLPRGGPGSKSAQIDVRAAAIALIALAAPGPPIAVAAEAERIADFRFRAIDRTHASKPPARRHHIDGLSGCSFLDFLVEEINALRGAHPDHEVPGWSIGDHEAAQRSPDRLVFCGLPTGDAVHRVTVIPGRLLGDVAALFPPLPAQKHAPKIMVQAAAVLAGSR
jgi:hypothetical protein